MLYLTTKPWLTVVGIVTLFGALTVIALDHLEDGSQADHLGHFA
jgi:hypothetical protein